MWPSPKYVVVILWRSVCRGFIEVLLMTHCPSFFGYLTFQQLDSIVHQFSIFLYNNCSRACFCTYFIRAFARGWNQSSVLDFTSPWKPVAWCRWPHGPPWPTGWLWLSLVQQHSPQPRTMWIRLCSSREWAIKREFCTCTCVNSSYMQYDCESLFTLPFPCSIHILLLSLCLWHSLSLFVSSSLPLSVSLFFSLPPSLSFFFSLLFSPSLSFIERTK